MSKINQIQNKLRELSGEAFQKLADAYLHKRGYDRINSLGSVIGANKVKKGTPDTLIPRPNGKYVFAEYTTTQPDNLFAKLNGDIDKCFNETKTNVPVDKIEEIVICHTSTLTAEAENALSEKCRKRSVNLNIFGISPISYDLYQKYPGIAKDFLGVEVDTGQIMPPDEFVAVYNKKKLATSLDTRFHFREDEAKQISEKLEDGDLVIVTGRAGVGKSRLALECCERFKSIHPEYELYCIYNKGPDLFEDLRVYFSMPGQFLILVDDANRISRFDYIIDLLLDRREARDIKVIATARDYALDKVRDAARPHGGATEVEIPPLEEAQIKQLVEDEFGIHNHIYLDRIADIAKGNPRLAIMAGEVAKRENTLQSISDVSALYDDYFATIRKDFEELGNADLLRAAGTIAFFRVIDRSNETVMTEISEAFNVSPLRFWENVGRLHKIEVCDVYEDEVVRTADQVLATYLFYLAFFKTRVLDFGGILKFFFPAKRSQLVDAINPVLGAFNSEMVMDIMRPHVDNSWLAMEQAGNAQALFSLIDVFWFLKQTETLIYLKNQIDKIMPERVDINELDFKATSNIAAASLLSVISSFQYADSDNFEIALNLLFDYIEKQPREIPKAIYLLTEDFGFTPDSYSAGFHVQRSVIEAVWKRTHDGGNALFTKVFLTLAGAWLDTHYHVSQYKVNHTISLIKFNLPSTSELFTLRKMIWTRLFELYRNDAAKLQVLAVIYDYSRSGYKVSGREIITKDAMEVLPFFEIELDPAPCRHCMVVQEYLDFLEERDVTFPTVLRDRFRSETNALSEILLIDFPAKRTLKLSYEEYQQYKREQIVKYFSSYKLADYKRFFEQCLEIRQGLDPGHADWQLQNGVTEVFLVLSERDSAMFVDVLKYYLEIGEPLKLNPYSIMKRLLDSCNAEDAYKVISEPVYPSRKRWLLNYYETIPMEEIKVKHLNHLYFLYQEAAVAELPQHLDYLLKFRHVDQQVVAHITAIVLRKAEDDHKFGYAISLLFNPYAEVNKIIINLFDNDIGLLKRAYFAVMKVEQNLDFDCRTFDRFLDVDSNFILEYIDYLNEQKGLVSQHSNSRDYSVLWMRNDSNELMRRMIDHIYENEQTRAIYYHSYLESFFAVRKNEKHNDEITARQDSLLSNLVKIRYGDRNFIQFLFSLIAEFSPVRRRQFMELFLKYNDKFEYFEDLPLESPIRSWSGSAIPMLQERLEYLESLLPLLNTVDLLQHKLHVERKIKGIRLEIERENKSDFMDN